METSNAAGVTAAYTVRRVSGDPDWGSVPVLNIDRDPWLPDTGIRAYGQLCHTDDGILVRLRAVEKEIRAVNTEPLSRVWEDSCLEFFFRPGDTGGYFNFEMNPNGCLRLQFGPDRTDRVDLVRADAADYFGIRTGRTGDGWEAFYRVPLKFIRLYYPEYRFGDGLRANLYKCGDKTPARHYLSWAPIGLERPDFHRPEFFGTLRFE